MQLGNDFFKWFRFITLVVKLLIQTFGNGDDQKELEKNHIDPDDPLVK